MNSDDVYERLLETFDHRDINYDLVATIKKKNVSDIKNTIKIYLLQFLLDCDDKTALIKNKDDLWFISENAHNLNMINRYIESLIDLIKREDISNVDIIKEIEPFMNTDVGTKLAYTISILNKCKLPRIIYLLYLGFIIGENQEFIKNNYLLNLIDLLKSFESSISHIDSKMIIYSLSETALEILNLYIFSKIYLTEERSYIDSIEKILINSDYNDKDLKLFYKKLEKEKLIDYILLEEENTINSEIYKKKVSLLTQNIKAKINELKDINNNQLNIQSSKNVSIKKDINKEEKEEINFINGDKKVFQPLIENNNSSSNNKILINEIELKKYEDKNGINININGNVDKNENKKLEEDNIQTIKSNKKDSIDELSKKQIEIINNSTNINGELFEGNGVKGKNDNSFINNSNTSTIKENGCEKKTNLDIPQNSKLSPFEDKFFEQINSYSNYPKIEDLDIPIDDSDKKKGKYLFIRINSFLTKLDIRIEKFDNILKSSIFDMITNLTNIKNSSKFKLFNISNLRLEILINLLKNANIINIKRKLIEVLLFQLFFENIEYFELNEDYIPSPKNIKDLENLIRAKHKDSKKCDEILNKLNNLKEEFQKEESNLNKKDKSKIKIIDENKRYELDIAKRFLDFYKRELNLYK